MNTILKTITVAALALTISGCSELEDLWDGGDCSDEINDNVAKYGVPEDTNRYSSGDYHSVDYWWWSKGVNKTFSWDDSSSCDVSTYTFGAFEPIEEDVQEDVTQ